MDKAKKTTKKNAKNSTVKKTVNTKKKNVKKETKKEVKKDPLWLKIFVLVGVIVLLYLIFSLGKHFFVDKSDIKINMSTDKKLEYVMIDGKEEMLSTQKYVSDLGYSIRYDIDSFYVFKYQKQDIFEYTPAEKTVLTITKSELSDKCLAEELENGYNNCYLKLDDHTEEYYISMNNKTFKITVKSLDEKVKGLDGRIKYMLDSFQIN